MWVAELATSNMQRWPIKLLFLIEQGRNCSQQSFLFKATASFKQKWSSRQRKVGCRERIICMFVRLNEHIALAQHFLSAYLRSNTSDLLFLNFSTALLGQRRILDGERAHVRLPLFAQDRKHQKKKGPTFGCKGSGVLITDAQTGWHEGSEMEVSLKFSSAVGAETREGETRVKEIWAAFLSPAVDWLKASAKTLQQEEEKKRRSPKRNEKGSTGPPGAQSQAKQSAQHGLRTAAAAALNPSRQIQVKIKEEKENKYFFGV